MTIKQYLEQLKEPERTQALNNLVPVMADKEVPGLVEALAVAFYWESSPEGFAYWEKVCKSIKINHESKRH